MVQVRGCPAGSLRIAATSLRIAATALAVAALAACGGAGGAADTIVHRGQVQPVQAGSLTTADVAAAQTAFGLDLLHAVCGQQPGENLLLSPTSAAEALGLLYPAAGGQTATDVRQVLHLPAWSPDLVAAIREHTDALAGLGYDGDLEADDAPDSLRVSNRIWTLTGLEPEQQYLDDVATAFDAQVQSLDFAGDPSGATDTINESVSDDTAGIIERLFDDALPDSTVVVLTNALDLKARWLRPFTDTRPADFAAPGGAVTVQLMSGGSGAGRTAGGWVAVELPYRDGTLTAVAMLPPSGTDPCTVDGATLAALDDASTTEVDGALPQLKIEQTHQLLSLLTGLGLPAIGDYSALGGDGLEISQVVQKTFLAVDEDGTEAAAATGVGVGVTALPAARDLVVFDRPFLLLLTDTATRSPLFLGVVNDPSA
ncbi:serpin family protein [Cellulomonas sp. KRMCY2]|uniref:serpin family protein n=1 Tax=Cellulomonas sp. KRMCY2 TaxID=1304865 RepID=UPI00045EC2BD|nr:serpin family protein [Cellulomonas sp. KRMCY2]